jgi:peptidyl-dipeptidase Dcp
VVRNVGNFFRPVGDTPSLLGLEEVETLFHELGHGLHSLLARCQYRQSDRVARDFVELPSQIKENWVLEPEVLKVYARHYETGGAMPDELIAKLWAAEKSNQGFAMVEHLAASFRADILARVGSEDPALLWQRFRGGAPSVDPLLERRGLK